MEDLPNKVLKEDFGEMSEILEAIKKCQTPEQIEKFYQKQVSKTHSKKYACENIKYCFENLEIDDKELIMEKWRRVIPSLGED